jgi:hypothetical protein
VLEVLWEREMDARVLGESTWDTVGLRKAQGSSLISQASVTAWDALRRARLLENWSSRTHT